jgi:hypothetical protein
MQLDRDGAKDARPSTGTCLSVSGIRRPRTRHLIPGPGRACLAALGGRRFDEVGRRRETSRSSWSSRPKARMLVNEKPVGSAQNVKPTAFARRAGEFCRHAQTPDTEPMSVWCPTRVAILYEFAAAHPRCGIARAAALLPSTPRPDGSRRGAVFPTVSRQNAGTANATALALARGPSERQAPPLHHAGTRAPIGGRRDADWDARWPSLLLSAAPEMPRHERRLRSSASRLYGEDIELCHHRAAKAGLGALGTLPDALCDATSTRP